MTQQAVTEDFPAVSERYRREIFAHCYRMTGSTQDAEDLVQETYLRAWKAYDAFEHRSSVRTWLYRIATNTCLTALDGRARRPLPTGLGQPSVTVADPIVEDSEVPWLQPVPDAVVDTDSRDPAAIIGARESIRLAFIAALQHLPPLQRAVLVLRDVLAWRAKEVADALGTSVASVNSALQRARAQLAAVQATEDSVREDTLTAEQQDLLDRWTAAFWEKDIDAITRLFTQDIVWEMPPHVGWYQGADVVAELIDTACPGRRHTMRMVPTRANGQPAFGLYLRGDGGRYHPFHLQVLTLRESAASHVVAFFDQELFATFGLPAVLPADDAPAG
ncbi:sigma-70 family RNA polymerase sigma factor [Flexivirga sp. ID2601S]|uniref:RNA polymerase sigma factor n=1 Tax=Flexivirga aerilata TaxID=1656889 RepID=A0A849AJ04_9MICO|nr:sigma-70 family RNA polymerase sigma factor [Flexivirga aerilata]NNG39817.1 sigma-70 family RNA polymerase sigma factor [Flexivirga aerilata]